MNQNAVAEKQISNTGAQLGEQNSLIGAIDQTLGRLEELLEPVLTPLPPSTPAPPVAGAQATMEAPRAICPVAHDIRCHNYLLETILNNVQHLIKRVEV